MSIFLDRLDEMLREKGMMRKQMLRELELGKNSFLNWQTRETLPNGTTLVKIADYFDVSLDWLVGRSEERRLRRCEERQSNMPCLSGQLSSYQSTSCKPSTR